MHLQVFSAFGFVHKIATFEKSAGFQVCIMVRVTWLSPMLLALFLTFIPWCGAGIALNLMSCAFL